uniref:Y-family DNA polymerase n=1 Tax=Pseudomonas sp. TaxID=306 RepID=UPI0028A8EF06
DRDDAHAPLVLITGPLQRRVLQAVNPAAARLGLRAGQSLTAARALAQGFTCVEADPARIEQVQQLLAAWAYGYSAQVSLHYPRALLLEVGSSLQLFGPWSALQARMREQLDAMGLRQRIVLATSPAAARMLANVHDGLALNSLEQTRAALAQLPIERIGLPTDAVQAFSRMGLRRLDQVLALPRAALARRFAASVQLHLDQLLGLRSVPLAFYQPPERFESRLELNFDVESHQALLFPVRRLINDLAVFLAARDSAVQRLDLYLEHAGGESTLLKVGLLSAEREAALLFELTRGRLEALQLPAPVRSLRLQVNDLPAFVPTHQSLFDARPAQSQSWDQLRERLRARLGDTAVMGLSAQADHRPEQAWRAVANPASGAVAGAVALRPGWLLAEPQALPPSSFTLLGQAERIESGWWDGGDVRRDYFRIETREGLRGWAYQDLGQPGPVWLQGWFA